MQRLNFNLWHITWTKKISLENNIDLILDSNNYIISSNSINITQIVLEELNKIKFSIDLEKFNALGVSQYGQMTAGSYMYIGPQGIVHGTTITVLNAFRKINKEKKC